MSARWTGEFGKKDRFTREPEEGVQLVAERSMSKFRPGWIARMLVEGSLRHSATDRAVKWEAATHHAEAYYELWVSKGRPR